MKNFNKALAELMSLALIAELLIIAAFAGWGIVKAADPDVKEMTAPGITALAEEYTANSVNA